MYIYIYRHDVSNETKKYFLGVIPTNWKSICLTFYQASFLGFYLNMILSCINSSSHYYLTFTCDISFGIFSWHYFVFDFF